MEKRLVVAKTGRGVGGRDWEFGISRCKLLYTGWINKVLLYIAHGSTSNILDEQ